MVCYVVLCCAGTVIASLLPLPSAKPLGVDSAEADAGDSESRSESSADVQSELDDSDSVKTARYSLSVCGNGHTQNLCLPIIMLYDDNQHGVPFCFSKQLH